MLKKIAKRIDKELRQAEDYVEQAYLIRDKSSQTADLFVMLAGEELEHAEKLLSEGARLIEADKTMYDEVESKENDEWKQHCAAIWSWEKRLANDCISECRYKIRLYKNR